MEEDFSVMLCSFDEAKVVLEGGDVALLPAGRTSTQQLHLNCSLRIVSSWFTDLKFNLQNVTVQIYYISDY